MRNWILVLGSVGAFMVGTLCMISHSCPVFSIVAIVGIDAYLIAVLFTAAAQSDAAHGVKTAFTATSGDWLLPNQRLRWL